MFIVMFDLAKHVYLRENVQKFYQNLISLQSYSRIKEKDQVSPIRDRDYFPQIIMGHRSD